MKKDLIERTIQVISSMAEPTLAPKRMEEIAKAAGLPETTTWRILKALEKQGWAVHDSSQHTWILGAPLTQIAYSHKRYMLDKVNSVHQEYREITGEEFRDD